MTLNKIFLIFRAGDILQRYGLCRHPRSPDPNQPVDVEDLPHRAQLLFRDLQQPVCS